jgi:muramoyltetrapeptide carboxypeptidase
MFHSYASINSYPNKKTVRRSEFLKFAAIGAVPGIFLKHIPGADSDNLIRPKKLKPGDTIALSAPAGIVFDESDFSRMKEVLESFELNVVFGEFVRKRHGYFSGTDYQRASELNRLFSDPGIDAILAVRGGWGSSRILPYLDFELIKHNPKIFCGFSDITTLNLAFLKHCGLVTFHGPNGASDWTKLTRKSFKAVLMDGEAAAFRSKSVVNTLMPGTAEGPLIGGNLTIFTTSLGTSYQPSVKGAILFLEDIGEPAYKIDRMLTHLKAAGIFDGISGFVFGKCTNCPKPSMPGFTMEEVIRHHIEPLGVPAVTGVDIGHDPDNFTIPIGIGAKLDAGSGEIELIEPGVI